VSGRHIEFRGVTFGYYRQAPVVHDVSLNVESGLTLVLGPNGSGKSTLLKLAAGVEKPDSGHVLVNGHDLWADELPARRDLAYVPEEPDLTPYASVAEILHLVCRLRGEPSGQVAEALSAAGLEHLGGRSVRQLSKGERRRALLAAAWIGKPRTLLLDEPLDAVDQRMRQHLLAWVEETLRHGGLAFVVGHEIGPLAPLAQRAIAVRQGTTQCFNELPAELPERIRLLERLARGEDA